MRGMCHKQPTETRTTFASIVGQVLLTRDHSLLVVPSQNVISPGENTCKDTMAMPHFEKLVAKSKVHDATATTRNKTTSHSSDLR